MHLHLYYKLVVMYVIWAVPSYSLSVMNPFLCRTLYIPLSICCVVFHEFLAHIASLLLDQQNVNSKLNSSSDVLEHVGYRKALLKIL